MTARFRVVTKMFNEAAFLGSFLHYYIEHGAAEIVLFDDGSTDDSVAVAKKAGPCIRVQTFDRPYSAYDRVSDEQRCQELFSAALRWTQEPCWWLFPDVDELIRPAPNLPWRLADALCYIDGVDGIPCVGLHCLPRVPEDERFNLSPDELLPVLEQVAPPRSFERAHCAKAAWKTPIWFFGTDAGRRYRELQFSSGSHLLLGDTSHLRYARPAWPLYHYKLRRVSSYLEHARQVLARIPDSSHYKDIWGPSHDRVSSWSASRYRLLRLAPVLNKAAIRDACQSAEPPGVYFESPFRPGVWGHG